MAIDPTNLAATATLTFDDEFNSFSAWNGKSGIWDTGYPWAAANGGSNASNNEEEWYVNANYVPTSGLNTYDQHGGVLDINAAPASAAIKSEIDGYDYTSGMITTFHSFSQTYGYFEMKAKLPEGQGLWPAFWLLPENETWPPEIDAMETIGSEPNVLNTTVHYGSNSSKGIEIREPDLTNSFHTYGVDWEKDNITWYFDGKEVYQVATPAGFDKPMYMLANLAVGGSWPGSPDSSTTFPATMEIDYIRAYSSAPGTGQTVTPPPTSGGSGTGTGTGTGSGTGSGSGTHTGSGHAHHFNLAQSGASANSIIGTSHNDHLTGTGRADYISGRQGADTMAGEAGNDHYVVGSAGDTVVEAGNAGVDTVTDWLSHYTLTANVENGALRGGAGHTLTGNGMANLLMNSSEGAGTLAGGAGDDELFAGHSADTLTGGAGHDEFVFRFAPSTTGHITDFTPGTDILDLHRLLPNYHGSDPVADGRLIFASDGKGNTVVEIDRDGAAGPHDAVAITTLDHVAPSALHAADYFV